MILDRKYIPTKIYLFRFILFKINTFTFSRNLRNYSKVNIHILVALLVTSLQPGVLWLAFTETVLKIMARKDLLNLAFAQAASWEHTVTSRLKIILSAEKHVKMAVSVLNRPRATTVIVKMGFMGIFANMGIRSDQFAI